MFATLILAQSLVRHTSAPDMCSIRYPRQNLLCGAVLPANFVVCMYQCDRGYALLTFLEVWIVSTTRLISSRHFHWESFCTDKGLACRILQSVVGSYQPCPKRECHCCDLLNNLWRTINVKLFSGSDISSSVSHTPILIFSVCCTYVSAKHELRCDA